jgi:hypothetical protein
MPKLNSGMRLNDIVAETLNTFSTDLRKKYWMKTLTLKEVKDRMTEKKRKEFMEQINTQCDMEFTVDNIKNFILNLMKNYDDTLTEAVADIFEEMTMKYHYHEDTKKNIHLFNGWKTNEAFYVNEKVILPVRSSYQHPFLGYSGWELNYSAKGYLDDIDKVMNYFDGRGEYVSISDALKEAFTTDKTRSIESTYFKISVYKKGTIHLTFLSEDIRRRFNITACKHKNWLPEDYGKKAYSDMRPEERNTVREFEGEKKYNKNINQVGFIKKDGPMIEFK